MLSHRKSYFYLKIFSDLIWLSVAFLLASFWAKYRISHKTPFPGLQSREFLLLLIVLIIWYFSSRSIGLYDEFRTRTFSFELIAVVKSAIVQLIASIVILFFIKTLILSRFFIVSYFVFQLILLFIWRVFLHTSLRWLRRRGRNIRFVLIIGAGRVGQEFNQTVLAYPHLGYRVVGFLDDKDQPELGKQYLGPIDNLDGILSQGSIDEVIIALPSDATEAMDHAISVCEKFTAQVRIIPDYFRYMSSSFSVSIFASFPIITVRSNPLDEFYARFLKTSFDMTLTVMLFLLVFSWLWPIIALAIKLTSPGRVFFKQERWGRKNQRINCYKFRTMRKESHELDENGFYLQAVKNDPRVTKVGRFLRKSNLDELPQFINVLKREMSIVGPRPHPTPLNNEVKKDVRHYMLRHLVKPGITGWAQVNGFRGETRDLDLMQKRVDHDIWYIENWTFWLDLQIIFLTVRNMIKGDPKAY